MDRKGQIDPNLAVLFDNTIDTIPSGSSYLFTKPYAIVNRDDRNGITETYYAACSPDPTKAMLCLRAVRSVTVRNGVVAPATRALMTTAMQSVLMIDADLDALLLITPAELAAGMHTPGLSEQVVQAMLVGVLADGELNPDCVARVAAFAEALGIELPALHTVRVLCEPTWCCFGSIFCAVRTSRTCSSISIGTTAGSAAPRPRYGGLRGMYQEPALASAMSPSVTFPSDMLGHAYFRQAATTHSAFPESRTAFRKAVSITT